MNSTPLTVSNPPNVIIQAIGFDLTESIREHVLAQAERLFRHEPTIEDIRFYCEVHDLKNASQLYILTSRIAVPGPDIKVEVRDENFYKGIRKLSQKLDRQLRRRSRKFNNHRNRRVELMEFSY